MAVVKNSLGGRAAPKPPKPRVLRAPVPKPVSPQDSAMNAFRTALAQLKSSVTPVDAAAIRAPYDAASVATGQLGTGLANALAGAGQTAQTQYNQGLAEAQRTAAQFGIGAGAGANPAAVQDTGTGYLANQTQAQVAAAPQAATAWQQLLARTAAAKVSDATTQRQGVLDQGAASLSASIPSLIGNEKSLAFQRKTEADNMGLARSQLTAKQQADLRDYLLGGAKLQQTAEQAQAANQLRVRGQNITIRGQNLASADKAKSRAITQRAQAAKANGLKGIDAVTKALTTPAKSSKTTVPAGWDVTVQVLDPDTGDPNGETRKLNLPDKRKIPEGFKFVSAQPATRTKATTTGGGALTAKSWDQYFRSLRAQNPGRDAEIKAYLGQRPKK